MGFRVTAQGMSDDGIHQRVCPYPPPTLTAHSASAEAGTEEQSRRLMIDVLDALTIARLFWQDDPHDAIMRRNLNISRDSSNLESCSEKSPKISALSEIRRVFQISRLPPSSADYSESLIFQAFANRQTGANLLRNLNFSWDPPSRVRFSDFSLKNSTRTAHRSRFSVFTGTRADDVTSSTAPTPATTVK